MSSSRPVAALVLAAGKSTRMKSRVPKALHPVLGKPLLRWATDAVQGAGASRTVLVIGHAGELVQGTMGTDFEYATQAEQKGTGHAVLMARPLLRDWDGPLLVLPGDAPLLTATALSDLLELHTRTGAAATLLSAELPDAGSYGRIVRNEQGRVVSVVEARDASPEQLLLREINASVYVFEPRLLFHVLDTLTPANAQGEYYLTDAVALLARDGHTVEALVSPDPDVARGVNTRPELAELAHVLQQRILRAHGLAGVTIVDPVTTQIDAHVKIGQDTVVYPFSVLSGVTDIGADCQIGPGARITDAQIGDSVTVRDSYVVASTVEDGAKVGPYAHVRPGSVVGARSKVGSFVELKNATLAENVSAGHLTYLGDATVGANTNIGAGTITCNYDGERKHQTTIGADAFVGTHSTLVAPVTVGDGAWTAAGSVITEDVPAGDLGVGRARQVNKAGWAARRRKA